MSDFSSWSTESLRSFEERLYDDEVAGDGDWFTRDAVLRELASRSSESGD